MDIVRNDDGTLVVPIEPERRREVDEATGDVVEVAAPATPDTMVLHPGEGGYHEALATWDSQQHPDRGAAVSTPSGREEAATVIHAVAEDPDRTVAEAIDELEDPEATGEALRHVLVGGVHSVEDFAFEVADATDSEPLPPHEATKIIGKVLSELDG